MDFSLINPQNSTSDDFSLINPQIYSKHIFNPEIPTTSILPSYSVVSASASSVRSMAGKPFDVFRHLDVAPFGSSNV